jgi:hypothetical protein
MTVDEFVKAKALPKHQPNVAAIPYIKQAVDLDR